jgi:hypothetical protein
LFSQTIDLPIKVKSPNRQGRFWKSYHFGYAKPVRFAVRVAVRCKIAEKDRPTPPLVITMTRIAPRELDGDNVTTAMKPVRDGIADGLGLTDDAERNGLRWECRQMRGMPKEYGLRIEIAQDRQK